MFKRTAAIRDSAFALAFVLCSSAYAYAEEITGRIVSVHDGDTATLLTAEKNQVKIRLAGIDAPELKQAYGRVSRDHLASLIANHTVTVTIYKKDRYGRSVGKILVGSIDANLEQVQAGLAWHYKKYEREQEPDDRQIYADAEVRARTAGIGLWRDDDPTPPWVWRK